MNLLTLGAIPVYLPFDTAPIEFGEPLACTVTHASPGVVTAPGYAPTNGDQVQFSAYDEDGTDGAIPGGLSEGVTYFVVSASGDTFEVSLTEGGSAISTSSTGTNVVLHILDEAAAPVALPFKTGNTVLVYNTTGSSINFQGADDTNLTGQYGFPTGPGSFTTLIAVPAYSFREVTLANDWIKGSATGLQLLQN